MKLASKFLLTVCLIALTIPAAIFFGAFYGLAGIMFGLFACIATTHHIWTKKD